MRYEYKVEVVSGSVNANTKSAEKLEAVCQRYGYHGWRLATMTNLTGAGGFSSRTYLLTFERPLPDDQASAVGSAT